MKYFILLFFIFMLSSCDSPQGIELYIKNNSDYKINIYLNAYFPPSTGVDYENKVMFYEINPKQMVKIYEAGRMGKPFNNVSSLKRNVLSIKIFDKNNNIIIDQTPIIDDKWMMDEATKERIKQQCWFMFPSYQSVFILTIDNMLIGDILNKIKN